MRPTLVSALHTILSQAKENAHSPTVHLSPGQFDLNLCPEPLCLLLRVKPFVSFVESGVAIIIKIFCTLPLTVSARNDGHRLEGCSDLRLGRARRRHTVPRCEVKTNPEACELPGPLLCH